MAFILHTSHTGVGREDARRDRVVHFAGRIRHSDGRGTAGRVVAFRLTVGVVVALCTLSSAADVIVGAINPAESLTNCSFSRRDKTALMNRFFVIAVHTIQRYI